MLRVGIIGTDGGEKSGHSGLICRMIASGKYDAEVTAVMGDDEEETLEVARLSESSPCIAKNLDELLEKCDAVMILHRNGNHHTRPCIKALKAKKAVFVDKPLACTVEDAEIMIKTAKESNAVLHSGSYLCYAPALAEIKKAVKEKENIRSVYISFPLVQFPDAGGIHFYSHHILTEFLTVFDEPIKSVYAMKTGENIAVVADAGSFPVFFNYSVAYPSFHFGVYFADGTNIFKEIDLADSDEHQLKAFLEAAHRGDAHDDYNKQLIPVKLSCAIEKSLETGIKTDIIN